jgi:hypothetical protein
MSNQSLFDLTIILSIASICVSAATLYCIFFL